MAQGQDSKELITMKQDGVQVKYTERTRNRVKFQIKFKEEEATAFKNYAKVFKDPEMAMDDFIRVVFFTGMEALNEQVVAKVKADMEDQSKDLDDIGVKDAHAEVTDTEPANEPPAIKSLQDKDDRSEG